MSQEESPTESRSETVQQVAEAAVKRLEALILEVDEARSQEGAKPLSERVLALIADTTAIAESIRTGAVSVGQPRAAINLLEVVAELDAFGNHPLACSFRGVLAYMTASGLTAENCPLGRTRIGPGKV